MLVFYYFDKGFRTTVLGVLMQHPDLLQSNMNKDIPTFEKMENNESIQAETESHRHFGNIIPLSWREDGEPKYVLGPHFVMFLITLLLTSLFVIAMGYSIVSHSKKGKALMSIAIIFSILLYIYCYIKVGFSNPGVASSWQQPPEEVKTDYRYCVPCRIVRPLKTVHCYSCDVCIAEYDHHCPWVGKCIGRDNYCQFRSFLYSALQLLVVFALCMFFGEEQSAPLKI